ncbi:MAG: hypothetical protein ACT4NY_19885 [Pseudonocardiales bacterium]
MRYASAGPVQAATSRTFRIQWRRTVALALVAVLATATGSGDPPNPATPHDVSALRVQDGPALRLAGVHTFTAADPATVWELRRVDSDRVENDEDEDQPLDTAIGGSATFYLPANEDEAVTYEVRSGADTREVTVLPADTVTRFDGVHPEGAHPEGAHPDVRTYAVVPSTLSSATHVLFVLHGQDRNAKEYCQSWVDWAAKADYVVLCPEFDNDDWSGSAGYNLGNVFAEDDGKGVVNPEQEWAFTVVEQVHRAVDTGFGLDDELFDMWGHSAGAQFVHRFVLFKPRSAVRFALAANAGWYTTPDPDIDIPYGLRHPQLDLGATVTREHLVLMRGQLDTESGDDVRAEPEAEEQGRTRYERAGHMLAAARAADLDTNWQLVDVPGADHDQVAMSDAAQLFLLAPAPPLPHTCPLPDADPCP